jgi:protein deglycase
MLNISIITKDNPMSKTAIIILADGFEEMEAITPIDLLRRAGINVTLLGLTSTGVRGSHDIVIKADMLFDEFKEQFDALILPGGPGHKNLLVSQKVLELIVLANKNRLLCAAICAAPVIFGKAGILTGKKATCFPGMESGLVGAMFIEKNTVFDENIITSRGAGTAVDFSLEIITYLTNKATTDSVAKKIVFSLP